MATVQATINFPLAEASVHLRQVAATQNYALHEGAGAPNVYRFVKGPSLFWWGSELSVQLAEASPESTSITIHTYETWAITDWGRGQQAATKLIHALGATPV